MANYQIDITNESSQQIDGRALEQAIQAVLSYAEVQEATMSIAVVDNDQIWDLNRKFLDHDYATDVLSFRLSEEESLLEGEVVVSREMAAQKSQEIGDANWNANHELILYVIHGALHLVGFDDKQPENRARMQRAEREILSELGILSEAAFEGRDSRGAEGGTLS